MRGEREGHVDLRADPLDQAADFGQIGGHVEHAIGRADDVDLRPRALLAGLGLRHDATLGAIFCPKPVHRAIRALPLILVDGARQESLDVGALRRDAAADHLGDGTGDHDSRQMRIQHRIGLLHRVLGAGLAEFLLAQTRHDDGEFVRWQPVGVVQHRGHRQVLATDRPIDDDLQPLDGAEHVDCAPVATGPVVIEHQHQGIASCAWRSFSARS